jgi:hypothetical protein
MERARGAVSLDTGVTFEFTIAGEANGEVLRLRYRGNVMPQFRSSAGCLATPQGYRARFST